MSTAAEPGAPVEGDLLDRLRTLRVAKDLFDSEWYTKACGAFFSAAEGEVLRRIMVETRQERDRVLDLVQEMAALGEDARPLAEAARERSRHGVLDALIQAKEAAGEALESVAARAPPVFRERLLGLAAEDFRHALDLREIQLARYRARGRVPS